MAQRREILTFFKQKENLTLYLNDVIFHFEFSRCLKLGIQIDTNHLPNTGMIWEIYVCVMIWITRSLYWYWIYFSLDLCLLLSSHFICMGVEVYAKFDIEFRSDICPFLTLFWQVLIIPLHQSLWQVIRQSVCKIALHFSPSKNSTVKWHMHVLVYSHVCLYEYIHLILLQIEALNTLTQS